jgi:phospholipid/cholesterol/gamma-HCH transport system permease protein
MDVIVRLGATVCAQYGAVRHAAAVIGTALYFSLQPRSWRRPVRDTFARQLLTVGVEPVLFVCGIATLIGMLVVVQLAFWTGTAGESQMLGPLLVVVVGRELGPVLTNIIVTVRSSSAMATELAAMKIDGTVRAMEESGADPFLSLVMPRVLGMAVCTICLATIFILVALASGYLFGAWLGTGSRDFWSFTNSVLHALRPQDIASILATSVLPPLFASASCCIGGLSVGSSVDDIPRTTQKALTRSIAGLFVISAVVSLLTYLS